MTATSWALTCSNSSWVIPCSFTPRRRISPTSWGPLPSRVPARGGCHTGNMRIYTGTGDDGTTGRLYGGRVAKTATIVDAAGDIDEVIAVLGVARAQVQIGRASCRERASCSVLRCLPEWTLRVTRRD